MSLTNKFKENKSYKNLPLDEEVLIEILTDAKKKELEIALQNIPNSNEVILHAKSKKQISKSSRGSKYRGVSRNGGKWQVQLLGNLRKRYIGSIASETRAG